MTLSLDTANRQLERFFLRNKTSSYQPKKPEGELEEPAKRRGELIATTFYDIEDRTIKTIKSNYSE